MVRAFDRRRDGDGRCWGVWETGVGRVPVRLFLTAGMYLYCVADRSRWGQR
ncbi:hypothetical protein RRSWK_00874 [Rhodopirellula sp. SWK7]|nr:hypothetical protein RRSWK_00874 [Rhodopirellula sp. SWK7]